MTTSTPTSLFSEFSAQSKAQWEAQVAKDLKNPEAVQGLVWNSPDGMIVPSFATPEDRPQGGVFVPKTSKGWQYRECILADNQAQANTEALAAIEKGAQAITFVLSGKNADYQILFKKINLKETPVTVAVSEDFGALLSFLEKNNATLTPLKGGFAFDPLKEYLTQGTPLTDGFEQLAAAFALMKDSAHWSALQINTSYFQAAGASVPQQVGLALAAVVEYWNKLSDKGLDIKTLSAKTALEVGVGTHYFMEIAKLRALRLLLNKVNTAFGNEAAAPLAIHATTASYTLASTDPDTNMLRHTTEAMSAAIGGADSLSIAPHTGEYSSFTSRIARNISTLLREESYLDRVTDASSGSYYIENLTDEVAKAGWEFFQAIEAKGGLLAAFEAGFVQEAVAENHAKHVALWKEKKWVLVGVNKYLNPKEAAPEAHEAAAQTTASGVRLFTPVPLYQAAQS